VDQRLVRDGHIAECSHQALALYLFLIVVSDAKGLSFYSDAAVIRHLSMDDLELESARQNLIRVGLISYARPLYQVLALDAPEQRPQPTRPSCQRPMSVGQILKKLAEDAP
jgi:hypothetical protein